MFATHLYAIAPVELRRQLLDRTYNAFSVHCPIFPLAAKLQQLDVEVQVHPLTGPDRGVHLVNHEIERVGLQGAALPILQSTGVIAVDGNKRTRFPGMFDPADGGSGWTPYADGVHVLVASPDDEASTLQAALDRLPANTIYVPQQSLGLDFYDHQKLFKSAAAVVCDEDHLAEMVKQSDPVAALTDLLDRGVLAPVVALGRDRNWSAIAGQTRTTLAAEVSPQDRLARLLALVAERIGDGQVLNAALLAALLELDNAAVPEAVGVAGSFLAAVNALWS
ncbi:hypothetical protein [Anatilimnocola floriformis]|uniref:hypothetical protein n=1 Tax=Anatilimnocola floriformis TaxID=2948575 RepID=UPI0020C5AC8E|nr:hypothetical protein [Anatilimnocola floriformis]